MRMLRALALSSALVSVLSLPLRAEIEAQQPFEMVRTLQMLQEGIARGNTSASAVQRKLVTYMAGRFLAMERDIWKEPRNVSAVIVYVLSGGDPKTLKSLVDRGDIPDGRLELAKGALAYAEGRKAEALALLGKIDARDLTPSLAGHVALVQSTLVSDEQPKKAIPYLQLARLLMPGTLVEEAALRRQCLILAHDGDLEGFERLARQYMDRFGRSLYAETFREQFATTVVRLDYSSGPGRLSQLRNAIDRLPLEEQRELYLRIARLAVAAGAQRIADFASTEAERVSDKASVEDARARLYSAAIGIVGDRYEESLRTLRGMDAARLDHTDARLLEQSLKLATEIRRPPAPASTSAPSPLLHARKAADNDAEAAPPAVLRAREAMTRAETLLKEIEP
ncbi:MAG: chemotaxis protein MotC [Parvibaculaceae bacterium]